MIQPIRTQNAYFCPLSGAKFDKLPDVLVHIQNVINRRNALAGRVLSDAELLNGPSYSDPRTIDERSAWRIAHPWQQPQSDRPRGLTDEEKFAEMNDARFHGDAASKRESLKAFRERTNREFAEKRLPKTVDEKRERAKAYAAQVQEQAIYGGAPPHVRDLANLLVRIAEQGELCDFERYAQEYVDTVAAIRQAHVADIALVQAKLDAAGIAEPFALEPKPTPAPEPPKPALAKSDVPPHFSQTAIELEKDPERRKFMEQSNEAFWHWRTSRNEDQQ